MIFFFSDNGAGSGSGGEGENCYEASEVKNIPPQQSEPAF